MINQEKPDCQNHNHSQQALDVKDTSSLIGRFNRFCCGRDGNLMGDVLFFAFIDPASDEAQGFYDELAAGYEDVRKNGADILVCTTRENGNEMFADAPFPVILWNDSLKTALGVNSGMIGDPEVPNTASWYANGSFLSAWSSEADAKELAESAAAFAEMAKELSAGGETDSSGAAAIVG